MFRIDGDGWGGGGWEEDEPPIHYSLFIPLITSIKKGDKLWVTTVVLPQEGTPLDHAELMKLLGR